MMATVTTKAERGEWRGVTRHDPCVICDHTDWCATDGEAALCMRSDSAPDGWKAIKRPASGGVVFVPSGDDSDWRTRPRLIPTPRPAGVVTLDFAALAAKFAAESERRREPEHLASRLGGVISPDVFRRLRLGFIDKAGLRMLRAGGKNWAPSWPEWAWAFPEVDGAGAIIGFGLRACDGRKGSPSREKTGARRGLTVPTDLEYLPDPVYVCEGATSPAAALELGLTAVGRPSCTGGVEYLAELLRGRDVMIVGDNDHKPDGRWPGRDGAIAAAEELSRRWGRIVPPSLPPEGVKDMREWLMRLNGGAQ